MSPEQRTGRAERILTMRLEEVARALERGDARRHAAARLLEQATVATANAVSLELLSAAGAARIWRRAAEQHPVLEEAGRELRGAAVYS